MVLAHLLQLVSYGSAPEWNHESVLFEEIEMLLFEHAL